MSKGYISVSLTSNGKAQPIQNATAIITDSVTNRVMASLSISDSGSGKFPTVSVDAPDIALSLSPETSTLPYAICNVTVSAPGYYGVTVRGVQVFAERTAVLSADILALPSSSQSSPSAVVDIPTHQLFAPEINCCQEYDNRGRILSRVVIPENVTVHLGRPAEAARNVTVSFTDYIKNVCCSEIYATWPVEALKANIYAQISLVLNRIYTEWYRSRGYPYDITNSTAYDQYFVYGRSIEKNVSDLVDEIFTGYVRKKGTVNPYYTEYCDGLSVTCPGMKQWGSLSLAQNGYSALQILQYYYGSDIEIVNAEVVAGVPTSYRGYPITYGDTGEDVVTVQRQLARIAQNYPSIGNVTADGVFAAGTEQAVKNFQSIFNLDTDGIVGKSTWYRISFIYAAVKKLAELSGEGEIYGGDGVYPGTLLKIGSRGSDVSSLQYYINVIANGTGYVQSVATDGIFGGATEYSVRQIQSLYGLVVDGIVGKTTWDVIYNAYKGIIDNASVSGSDDFPGTLLRYGSRGDAVKLMQKYLNVIGRVFSQIPSIAEDGIFGRGTENAVRIFQGLFSLAVDGIIGKNTWETVVSVKNGAEKYAYGGNILSTGSRGDEVRKLQELLNFVGATYTSIPHIVADGIYGSATQNAVRALQRLADIPSDGVVGRITWNALLRLYLLSMFGQSGRFAPYPMKIGDEGGNVARLQAMLDYIRTIYTSLPKTETTGVYTENTENSVQAFRHLFMLPPSEGVDKTAWELISGLYSDLSAREYRLPLSCGNRGEGVSELQRMLNFIGKYKSGIPELTADGIFGYRTENAVKAFQRIYSLTADGIVGRITHNAILRSYYFYYYTKEDGSESYKGEPLGIGARGDGVMLIQRDLDYIASQYREIPTVNADGVYGSATQKAVAAFQELFEEASDGVVAEYTWNKIIAVYNELHRLAWNGEVLSVGSSGKDVLELQKMLNVIDPSQKLSEDGIFGENTKKAVIAFADSKGIVSDGNVGENLWYAAVREYVLIKYAEK